MANDTRVTLVCPLCFTNDRDRPWDQFERYTMDQLNEHFDVDHELEVDMEIDPETQEAWETFDPDEEDLPDED